MGKLPPQAPDVGGAGDDRHSYFLPFGRFTSAPDAEPPANEVLVGREAQRATFIDHLISCGRRGAFLITGRRGAGKTAFVRQCLREYDASVLKRFYRSTSGRGVLDRLSVLLGWATALLCAMLLSELASLGAAQAASANIHALLRWSLIAPLLLLLAYPLLYAQELVLCLLGTAKHSRGVTAEDRPDRRGLALLLMTALAGTLWLAPRPEEPDLIFGICLLSLGALYMCATALSYSASHPAGPANRDLSPEEGAVAGRSNASSPLRKGRPWKFRRLAVLLIVGLLAAINTLSISECEQSVQLPAAFGTSALYFSAGLLFRSWHLKRISRSLGRDRGALAPAPALAAPCVTASALALLVATATWVGMLNHVRADRPLWVLASQAVGAVVAHAALFAAAHALWKGKGASRSVPTFVSRPTLLLVLKAVTTTAFALRLAAPALPNAMRPIGKLLAGELTLPATVDILCVDWNASSLHCAPAALSAASGQDESPIRFLALLLTLGVAFYLLEYEWILRPGIQRREDRALDPHRIRPLWEDRLPGRIKRNLARRLAELSLPWAMYRLWLPTMPLFVNLGFDKLDHRRVVHAMLVALREQYRRTFLAWNSTFANVARVLMVLCAIALTTLADFHWFRGLPERSWEPATQTFFGPEAGREEHQLCEAIKADRDRASGFSTGSAWDVVCGFGSDRWLRLLNFRIFTVGFEDGQAAPLLGRLLPSAEKERVYSIGGVNLELLPKGIFLSLYHFPLFFTFLLAIRALLVRIPLLPYHSNVKKLDRVIEDLSATTRNTRRNLGIGTLFAGLLPGENEKQTEVAPHDPRSVELAFLDVLQEIQAQGIRFPGLARHHFSLPTPEVTFVFDELDKLGSRVDPDAELPGHLAQPQGDLVHQERQRSVALRSLLADLKNILSTAEARFIFVGGRNLYDEWLADQTARQPLLTSVFSAHIYLPSLLTDAAVSGTKGGFLHSVGIFFDAQLHRAESLFAKWILRRVRPNFALATEERQAEDFLQGDHGGRGRSSRFVGVRLANSSTVPLCWAERRSVAELGSALREVLVSFLAYRSMGNPRRLKELLASFVVPASRVLGGEARSRYPCRHVLLLEDTDIFRMQVVTEVFDHMRRRFEGRLLRRDDKLIVSALFLMDFVFKFHGRAFSWSNLERVDELVHIHRAPDLRDLLEELIDHCSERFLHRVLNGMYSFRFRSDVAHEIRFISRQTPAEMAAFNFTLDESQSLKALYASTLERGGATVTADVVSGLGELYEFDQEYEAARQYYLRAIDMLDTQMNSSVQGGSVVLRTEESEAEEPGEATEHVTSAWVAIRGGRPGRRIARLSIDWFIRRTRLMLQIGMTFELSRDLERAQGWYSAARRLSHGVVTSLGDSRVLTAFEVLFGSDGPRSRPSSGRLGMFEEKGHLLKHLNIIFQPAFAEAWAAEKMVGGVDTSTSLIEEELHALRCAIPFLREVIPPLGRDPVFVRGSNFALIAAQLHNKTGDLYFYKGRHVPEKDVWSNPRVTSGGTEGFLLKAHYHYCVSLHEVRRFLAHRRGSSPGKLGIASETHRAEHPGPWETLAPGQWPDFVYLAAANGVTDCAETLLARVSLSGLLAALWLGAPARDTKAFVFVKDPKRKTLGEAFASWIESRDDAPQKHRSHYGVEKTACKVGDHWVATHSLEELIGHWSSEPFSVGRPSRLIEFEGPHAALQRLVVAVEFARLGVKYFEEGGYPEDAGREVLQLCDTLAQYCNWIVAFLALRRELGETDPASGEGFIGSGLRSKPPGGLLFSLFTFLVETAVELLKKMEELFRQSRFDRRGRGSGESEVNPGHGGASRLVPLEAATTAIAVISSVVAGIVLLEADEPQRRRLGRLVENLAEALGRWLGADLVKRTIGKYATENGLAGGKRWTLQRLRRGLRALLEVSRAVHRYPVLNRLRSLKAEVDDLVLLPAGVRTGRRLARIVESRMAELLATRDFYGSLLHFTPLQAGVTGVMALRALVKWVPEREGAREKIAAATMRDLRRCEEMITMKRSFYECISDLYYLYDDFNDRQVHRGHALQMAGSELLSIMQEVRRQLGVSWAESGPEDGGDDASLPS